MTLWVLRGFRAEFWGKILVGDLVGDPCCETRTGALSDRILLRGSGGAVLISKPAWLARGLVQAIALGKVSGARFAGRWCSAIGTLLLLGWIIIQGATAVAIERRFTPGAIARVSSPLRA